MSLGRVLLLLLLTFMVNACRGGGPPQGGAVPVQVQAAWIEELAEQISLSGSLAADEAIAVKSEIDGRIAEIAVKEGDEVAAGDLLVLFDQAKLSALQRQAEVNQKLAQADLKRSEQLLAGRAISSQEHEQALTVAAARQAELEVATERLVEGAIRAPFAGLVGPRQVSPGQFVGTGTLLMSLVAVDQLKLEVAVPERYVGQVQIGQELSLQVAAYQDSFGGEIYFIAPAVSLDTRTFLVKAKVPNVDRRLKPGMFALASLSFGERIPAVVIPETALLLQSEAAFVYVVNGAAAAELPVVELRPVVPGRRLAGRVQIESGLLAGELVVTAGTQKLFPGAPVLFAAAAEPTATEAAQSL